MNNGILILPLLLVGILGSTAPLYAESDPWEAVPAILDRIRPPEFPEREFRITDYGAVPNEGLDALLAVTRAIAACTEAGGGRVVIPEGNWFVKGPIHLLSNVNLHAVAGAQVDFSTDPADYPNVLSRFEGTDAMNYSPLIYAYEQENIAITGAGTFHGRASQDNWWAYKRTADPEIAELKKLAAEGVPPEERIFGMGKGLRPAFFQPYLCRNILIEGVTFRDSPMWFLNPVLCENLTVRGVTVKGLGPNNDGCNPESTRDVLIEDCTFDTGDDCIAIKSGRDHDGRRINVPSENIVIRNCRMMEGHGGVVCGSEMSGGIRNVFAENLVMDSPHLERALRIKSNDSRGGFMENIHVRNVKVSEVADAVLRINLHYAVYPNQPGGHLPRVRGVTMENVTVEKAPRAFYLHGLAESPIRDVRVRNCDFKGIRKPSVFSHVENLNMDNVRINGEPKER